MPSKVISLPSVRSEGFSLGCVGPGWLFIFSSGPTGQPTGPAEDPAVGSALPTINFGLHVAGSHGLWEPWKLQKPEGFAPTSHTGAGACVRTYVRVCGVCVCVGVAPYLAARHSAYPPWPSLWHRVLRHLSKSRQRWVMRATGKNRGCQPKPPQPASYSTLTRWR